MDVRADLVRQHGSYDKYFAKHIASILKKTGMAIEEAILYNNLLSYTIDNKATGKHFYDAGGSTNLYSILAIHFKEDTCHGLYDPKRFDNGTLFGVAHIDSEKTYNITADHVHSFPGYGIM